MKTIKEEKAIRQERNSYISKRELILFTLSALCLFIGLLKYSGGSDSGIPIEDQILPDYEGSAFYLILSVIFYWVGKVFRMVRKGEFSK